MPELFYLGPVIIDARMGFQTVDQGFFFVQEELDEDLAVPLVPFLIENQLNVAGIRNSYKYK